MVSERHLGDRQGTSPRSFARRAYRVPSLAHLVTLLPLEIVSFALPSVSSNPIVASTKQQWSPPQIIRQNTIWKQHQMPFSHFPIIARIALHKNFNPSSPPDLQGEPSTNMGRRPGEKAYMSRSNRKRMEAGQAKADRNREDQEHMNHIIEEEAVSQAKSEALVLDLRASGEGAHHWQALTCLDPHRTDSLQSSSQQQGPIAPS